MGTLVVVHGAGVRDPGIDQLEINIKNGIADIAELKGLKVVMCRWGPEVGSMPARVSETLPKEVITRAAIQTPDDEQLEAARWSLLFDDPLFELRVAQAAPAGEAAGIAIGQVLAAQAAIEALQGLTSQADLPGPDTGTSRQEFAEAVAAIANSQELGMAADAAGTAADKEFVEAVARAVVAELIARHRLDAPGTQPAVAVNGAIRDQLVATLAERLAPDGTRGAIGWLKGRVGGFIAKRATALAADRRMAAQEASSGLVADVIHYLRRGHRIAEYVADCLKGADGPVIALGHSLGGIVLVDVLSRAEHPPVDLLVTVGSQAPVLYAYDALERPRDARDGGPRYSMEHPPFTPWLNIYNRNDFVSFLADDIFSHEIEQDLPIVDQELHLPEAFPAAHGAYWTDKETFRFIAAEAARIPALAVRNP
jgi:hypothetical protein